MMGWGYEARKCLLHPFLLVGAVILLILNGRMCLEEISRYQAAVTQEYLTAQEEIYHRVGGPITLTNMEWIISEHQRLNAVIQSGNFSTEYDPEGTYTGYVFSDNNLFNDIYEKARYTYEYELYSGKIAQRAGENQALYQDKGDERLAAWYAGMETAFEGRRVSAFYSTDGFALYFNYQFSNLSILILVLMGVYPVFSRERETGMKTLLQLTPKGTEKARQHKVLLILWFAWVVTTIFSLQDVLLFFTAFGFQGWNNPLYAIPEFSNTPLTVSIGGFCIINYLVKCLGVMAFSALVALASTISPSDLIALLVSCILFGSQLLLNMIFPPASFLPLLNSVQMCGDFQVVQIGGTSMPLLAERAIIQGGILLVLLGLMLVADVVASRDWKKGAVPCWRP